MRLLKHFFIGRWLVRRYFQRKELKGIAKLIADSENKHRAEIRVAIEASLPPMQVWHKVYAPQKAVEVFSQLRIWDTAENNGVLIYLLLADRRLEIIADRGIHEILGNNYWKKINKKMLSYFQQKQYKLGIEYAIEQITEEMVRLFPKDGEDPNELSDEVVLL